MGAVAGEMVTGTANGVCIKVAWVGGGDCCMESSGWSGYRYYRTRRSIGTDVGSAVEA